MGVEEQESGDMVDVRKLFTPGLFLFNESDSTDGMADQEAEWAE